MQAFEPAQPRLQRTHGAARIRFKLSGGATRLDRLFQSGAAKVRLPNVPADEPPQAVLINTAGGLTGGDTLAWSVDLTAGCRALITTQACEKIYRAESGAAEVSATLQLGDGARLDWLPQETILFDGARLARTLDAELAPTASLLVVEATLFGRAARGETMRSGLFRDRWRVRRGGRLVFADDLCFDWADGALPHRPAVLAGNAAAASILYVGEGAERHVEPLRRIFGAAGGVSARDGKLLARIVADTGAALRQALGRGLEQLLGGAALPRIWQT